MIEVIQNDQIGAHTDQITFSIKIGHQIVPPPAHLNQADQDF